MAIFGRMRSSHRCRLLNASHVREDVPNLEYGEEVVVPSRDTTGSLAHEPPISLSGRVRPESTNPSWLRNIGDLDVAALMLGNPKSGLLGSGTRIFRAIPYS